MYPSAIVILKRSIDIRNLLVVGVCDNDYDDYDTPLATGRFTIVITIHSGSGRNAIRSISDAKQR